MINALLAMEKYNADRDINGNNGRQVFLEISTIHFCDILVWWIYLCKTWFGIYRTNDNAGGPLRHCSVYFITICSLVFETLASLYSPLGRFSANWIPTSVCIFRFELSCL